VAMDKDFEEMIKLNIQGRVFVICRSHGVTDLKIVSYYREILEQAVIARLTDESTPLEFQEIMEEQLIWLEEEMTQSRATQASPSPPPVQGGVTALDSHGGEKKATGYVPEAKTMPERLKDRRSIMEQLLDNDCVTLKLVTPDEAKAYKQGLTGKDPAKAEEELVTTLRSVLNDQIREFIRKHNGGPWAGATLQHEVRMDITKTSSLRSLVILARELLAEREEWLRNAKGSLSGRLFGGRVKMDK
jgi:HEPN domain-containing protein